MSGRLRKSGGSSTLPRPHGSVRDSRIAAFRGSQSAQPSYDFITGAERPSSAHHARTPSRQSHERGESLRATSRESSKENLAPPDAEEYETQRKCIEELKAELATMRYRIETTEQEKEMLMLQHENEIREIQRKAEDDFNQKQAAEGEKSRAQRQYESMQEELQHIKENSAQEAAELDKRLREAQEEGRLLKEQLEDLSVAKEEGERLNQRRANEVESQLSDLQQTIQELEHDAQTRDSLLSAAQEQLSEKDRVVGDLEADVIRLKAQTGDAETIAIIRRELSDQVQHIRSLEAKTSKQHAELVHLRQIHKAVEIVEEEKRSLQRRVDAMEALEAELNETRIQKQRLEDERLAWTAFLQNASAEDGVMELDSPEAVARALVEERYNSASLMEKLGEIQPQIAERDEMIKSLESEKKNLTAQLEKAKAGGAPVTASKSQARLERQRALATKEIEYLRAQLKTFDVEDETFDTGSFDQQKADRISELEKLIDTYKEEVQTLHKELSTAESTGTLEPAVGSKRSHTDETENEQLGELNRKRRKLADDLSKLQSAHQLLQKEHEVTRSRLRAAESANKTRILSLRSNPTSKFEAIKTATLAALKQENQELLAQLSREARRSPKGLALIPASQLAAARRETEEAQRETASAQKTARRLKEVWAAKSQEFKEAIFSTLGWTVTFIPNGKMRVESLYLPSASADEHENSIVFDGERGTMKVSGGPQSPFARRIADQIQFWVRDKGCIPGFLAALTLEFYEEHSRAAGS
ncbi:putative Spindle assembly checkpoint component MAD1 [Rosellinia necatrix]|uniref:Spindle assembly checkpoint component MAD1 n=1 Tax=Rosellinia necatrix TaxID=77044 RepID=A0A1W2TEE2_ROSNE|nr:putative Spindle assembly checkpoint component MAD1 [Rosellinia necatrix]